MKLEKAKKLRNVFKLNLNKISRRGYKSEDQKRALENIKLVIKSREAVNNLSDNYFSIASEAKHKLSHGKGIPSMLARVAHQDSVPKASEHGVSDRKVFDTKSLKILSPKQMLQRLPIALTSGNLGN